MICKAILSLVVGQIAFAAFFRGAIYPRHWGCLIILSLLTLLLFWIDKSRKKRSFPLPSSIQCTLLLFFLSLTGPYLFSSVTHLPLPPEEVQIQEKLTTIKPLSIPLNPYESKLALYQWIIPLSGFIVTAYAFRRRKYGYFFLGAIVAISFSEALYGIYQSLTTTSSRPTFAVKGTFVMRNTYACFIAVGSVLAWSLFWGVVSSQKRRRLQRKIPLLEKLNYYFFSHPKFPFLSFSLLAALLSMMAVMLSYSRGSLLSLIFGLGILVLFFSTRKSSRKIPRREILFFLILLLFPLVFYIHILGFEKLFERFTQWESGVEGRWILWESAWNIIKGHWLFGVGAGNYHYALEVYRSPYLTSSSMYAHNDYLQFIAEYGAISSFFFSLFLLSWLREAWRNRPQQSSFLQAIWIGSIACVAVVFSHALVDFSLSIPSHRLLCGVFMGVALAKIK